MTHPVVPCLVPVTRPHAEEVDEEGREDLAVSKRDGREDEGGSRRRDPEPAPVLAGRRVRYSTCKYPRTISASTRDSHALSTHRLWAARRAR